MKRSMQLGHCICDPRQPCPCDIFREEDICPCAGEEREPPVGPIKLTETVESAGCASKIDQATLLRVMATLPVYDDPKVLVGMPAGDDAGVYQLDEKTALVQTVDVFSPSADDPYTFGQIAAANSLSDVYAMGGRPISALSIVGFPAKKLPDQILSDILRGGLDKMAEAGVPVIGGHSIKDNEIKAGFAVTGLIDPRKIACNSAARPGDRLVLTKPLGTGIVSFADQIGMASAESVEAACRSMTALNRRASELMGEYDAHACTDVTGFGLMGHLKSMAKASKVDVEIVWDDVPLLPEVLQCVADGVIPGGIERNRESSADALDSAEGVDPAAVEIFFDPQTSGGLLIALPEDKAEAFVERLHAEGIVEAAAIGRILGEGLGRINIRGEGRRKMPEPRRPARKVAKPKEPEPIQCCANPEDHPELQAILNEPAAAESTGGLSQFSSDENGTVPFGSAEIKEIEAKFQAFLAATNKPGRLDARTKRAMGIALSVLAKCEPCVIFHAAKARQEGFSADEIDEAAWLGIAFGGSPIMMFYNDMKKKL